MLAGLTQAQLAERIGVSEARVSEWEEGVSDPPATVIAALRTLASSASNKVSSSVVIHDEINRIRDADPKNFQEIGASQLRLLDAYYNLALTQSRRSFIWALVGSALGLSFFIVAVAFSLLTGIALTAVIPLLSGAIVEVVAGIVFYLYGKTTSQLTTFHSSLVALQRYVLANSLCENLDGEERNKARATLIQEISRPQPAVPPLDQRKGRPYRP
jgi:transcriptional regulator with XRE-family HTH domain